MAWTFRLGLLVLLLVAVSADFSKEVSEPEDIAIRQLGSIELMLKKLLEERSKAKLRQDIITAIFWRRFAVAEEKMVELDDPAVVAGIVREMTASSDRNFGILLKLTKSLTKASLKSPILMSLYYEVEKNDRISIGNLVALGKALSENWSVNETSLTVDTPLQQIADRITQKVTPRLVDALKSNESYGDNAEVRALSEAIADWPHVSEKVMIAVVAGVYGTVDNKKILEAVSNHTDPWQALVGVDNLIEKLKESDSFSGNIVINIAAHIAEIMTRTNLTSAVQKRLPEVKNKIPGCLMHLFTQKPFCIVHRSSRIAITVPDEKRLYLEWNEGEMIFKTEQGVTLDDYDTNKWIMEPYEDGCFLRHLQRNEYMYILKGTKDGRPVHYRMLEKKPGNSREENSKYVWWVGNC